MRLVIEATQDELAEKSEALVKAIAGVLEDVAPELADRLEKAIHKGVPKLAQPALRRIHEITRKEYEARLKWMVRDIGKVLDRSLSKAEEDGDEGPKEELEPGDINPDTGEEVPEEKEPVDDDEETDDA